MNSSASSSTGSMKFLRELLARILKGDTASEILTGLDPMNKGHTGEALLRLLVLFGIHPTDPSATVVPYHADPDSRRLEPILTLSERLAIIQHGLINAGGSNKIDVCWGDGATRAACSSKIGKLKIKSIADLEIVDMLIQFTKSGGYTEGGKPVSPTSVMAYVLVDSSTDVLALAERSKASNQVTKDNLNCLDVGDLNRMCAVFRSQIEEFGSKDPEAILGYLLSDEKPSLRTRFHQKLICSKVQAQIARGQKTLLIGALPRSGKTWMGAWIAKHFRKILIITTRPGETRGQWNRVFSGHREFSPYKVVDLDSTTSAAVAMSNTKNEQLVAIASTQFFKMAERDSLKGLDWDLVLLDEIHEGGSTDLTGEMLDTYIGTEPIRIMMTATYTKPVHYFMIPSDCCFFWDLEDVRLMRSWGTVFDRLCAKYGAEEVRFARDAAYACGETDASILLSYTNAPRLGILTTIMQQDIYDLLRDSAAGTTYGFSMRSLFMTTADGKAFQNQKAVDTFLALLSGSDKLKHYKAGSMSMFDRILRYWKTTGHRAMDEFMTQIWFLPSGAGQLLENVKGAMIGRIQANPVLKDFAILTLDSGMGDISKAVSNATVDAKGLGKKGLILLTGNVGSLGVSLPEVDVAFMLHDIGSADMNYQQMMRVGTEMAGKKIGLVVDFNVWRVLTTLNAYATSRCGQANKSSADRINWCISHLVDVDPDLWDCRDSPLAVSKDTIADRLTQEWRKMLEQTGSSLSILARKPFDLGEDQKLLDRIATHMEEGAAMSSVDVNEDQEALDAGLEAKSCSNSSTSNSNVEEPEEEEKEEEPLLKKANLNDVLSRLIPEFAILSGCETDLLFAIQTILASPAQHTAVNDFLIKLYSQVKGATTSDPLSILSRLIQCHYKNLIDARDIFEVISSRMSTLDNPKELIAFLGQHLKPKELEKKENGEVFTPPDLIQQKFDKLTLADPGIWSDPSKKFLDPANGIGNYPALAFHRLMDGLKVAIPNDADRKKHILENMLYMCELNAKNIEVSRKIFDPDNLYALNLYQGSFFDLNCKKEWNVESFDVIIGNPPYNTPGEGASGNTIWQHFVTKSLSLLSKKGYLVFVHPNGWRKPNTERGTYNGLFELMTKTSQMLHLSIHNSKEGQKTFKCGTRYDWYVLKNEACSKDTTIVDELQVSHTINLSTLSWLPNYKIKEITELFVKPGEPACLIMYDRSAYGADKKDRMSATKDAVFKYPCIHSTPKKGIRYMYSKFNDRGHFSEKKVIFGESGIHTPVLDLEGAYGMTHGAMGIKIDSEEEGKGLLAYITSPVFQEIIKACMFSSFRIDWNIFKGLRRSFWNVPVSATNSVINTVVYPASASASNSSSSSSTKPDYSKVTIEDLKQLCRDRGLSGFSGKKKDDLITLLETPTESPASNSSSSSSSSSSPSTPDYSKLTVDDLKQLCRDREIGGFSGKKKGDIIALLTK